MIMRRSSAFCQRWRTLALTSLLGTVCFLEHATASQSEGEDDRNVLDGNICNKADNNENINGKIPPCDLTKRLNALRNDDLDALVAYYTYEKADIPKKEPQESGKAFAWKLFFYGVSTTLQKSLIKEILKYILKKHADHGCYEAVGCFYPGNRMALELGGPIPPKQSSVKFYYYTSRSRQGKEVTLENWRDMTDRKKWPNDPLTIIFHGFKESKDTNQVIHLRDALLDNVGSDVIIVDWKDEAAFPYYGAAATNSPLVGAQASVLLQSMYNESSVIPDKVHLIGFSLGAHAAGFCGRHFETDTRKKLGRISGLDPAGLLFEYTNVSLSALDALFVDVIHTNGGEITGLNFGMMSAVGHIDFYPNGGSAQPGCTGDSYTITCSHNMAWWLYIESIRNKSCPFTAISCQDRDHYKQCLGDTSSRSAKMGFYSYGTKHSGNYYLETNSRPPYCRFHDKPSEETKPENKEKNGRPPR